MTARAYARNIQALPGQNLLLKTNDTTRVTINTSGQITTVGNTAVTSALTASTYNGYTPLNRAGDASAGTINAANMTVQGNQVYHPGNSNRVINRGNPGSGSPLLLSELDVSHLYTAASASTIDISTTMLENAVYEMYYSCNTSGANIDITLNPNYTTYASQFQQFYWCTSGATSQLQQLDQVNSFFYFDHQNGATGANPCGKWVIHNFGTRKHVNYQGGDTLSAAIGRGTWNNGSDLWVNVGTLGGLQSATDVRVIVRRIG
jgi:hypothetical protein